VCEVGFYNTTPPFTIATCRCQYGLDVVTHTPTFLLLQLVTAPLTRGDILAGVTRDSILELTRGWTSNHGPGAGTRSNML
jgi:hypothetical protein